MRPLTLEIKGLRSYRNQTRVDFALEGGLVAVVGDTGSGKSSLLEAMTYALYNAWSWSKGSTKDLIASDCKTMTVALTFVAENKTWRVTRSTSRDNYPPSLHELECIDDGGHTSGESDVNARIRDLLGLSCDAFLSSVILPQGRFETLLTADKTHRTAILMGILRLDDLAAAGIAASNLALRLTDVLRAGELLRAERFLPDPTTATEEAARQLADARERAEILGKAGTEVERLTRAINEAQARERTALDAARTVEQKVGADAAALAALVAVAAGLSARAEGQQEALRAAEAEARDATDMLEKAREKGEDVGELAGACMVLTRLLEELPKVAADRNEIDEAAAALVVRGEKLGEAKAASERLAGEAETAGTLAAAANAEYEDARSAFTHTRDVLLPAAKRTAKTAIEASARIAELGDQIPPLTKVFEVEVENAKLALNKVRAADEALAAAHRSDHAAAAGAGLHAGNLCPVCIRELPAGFMPPPLGAAAQTAQRVRDKAERDKVAADGAAATAGAALEALKRDLRVATEQLGPANTASAREFAALRHMAPDAVLDAEDEVILVALASREREARATKEATEGISQKAAIAVIAHETALKSEKQSVDDRETEIGRLRAALSERSRLLERDRGALPAGCRPPADSTPPAIAAISERTKSQLEKLRRVETNLRDAQTAARLARNALAAIADERKTTVDAPCEKAWRNVCLLADRISGASAAVGIPNPSLPLTDGDVAVRAKTATTVAEAASNALSSIVEMARIAVAQSLEAAASIARQVEALGLRDAGALREEVGRSRHEAEVWTAREAEARAQIAPAAELDAVIAPVGDRVSALREVAEQLTMAKFIGHVCSIRQEALLRAASEVLLAMTNGRLGFAADFKIGDNVVGQVRGARTLSGGETFLASLALALGLVEMAGRKGGRLEALFLDEGFGSLDTDSLDEAITALKQVATGGRMVTVVTHLRKVMEDVDRVLMVTRTVNGSTVDWLSTAVKEDMVDEDIASGLLE
jgi:exonuclease SbcC